MCLGYSCGSHPWLHFKITWELLKMYQPWDPHSQIFRFNWSGCTSCTNPESTIYWENIHPPGAPTSWSTSPLYSVWMVLAMLVQTRIGLERGPTHTWFQKLPRWFEVQAYFREIAGSTPDHCNKVRIIITWVVIFLLVEGLPSIVKKCNIYEAQ